MTTIIKFPDLPTLSENKFINIQPMRLPSGCNVYLIHETQGAESDEESLEIAKVMEAALNKVLAAIYNQ